MVARLRYAIRPGLITFLSIFERRERVSNLSDWSIYSLEPIALDIPIDKIDKESTLVGIFY